MLYIYIYIYSFSARTPATSRSRSRCAFEREFGSVPCIYIFFLYMGESAHIHARKLLKSWDTLFWIFDGNSVYKIVDFFIVSFS